MEALDVVLDSPRLDPCLHLPEAREVMQAQELIVQLAVEALDITILNGVAGPDEPQRRTVAPPPSRPALG